MNNNLRRRVATTVGVIPMVMVLIFGAVSLLLTFRSLRDTTDAELLANTSGIAAVLESERLGGPAGFPAEDLDERSESDAPFRNMQLLARDGSVMLGSGLVVSDAAVEVASGDTFEQLYETVEVDGQVTRVLTLSVSDEQIGAIQMSRDITGIASGLRRARTGTLVAGLLAGLVSAAIAWWQSKRLVAPVQAVADAADRIRADADLPDRIEGEGSDELGRLVTSFNQMLDELRDSREQQQRLVADASHELRTPLTSLRVKTEFLQSQPDLPMGERQRLLDGSVSELASLSSLVTELVGLAADGSSPDEAPALVDLGEIVQQEAERFQTSTGRQVKVSTSSGMIETRPNQVVRALVNLLVNAHKYTPTDQPIEVHQTGNRLEVRDFGPGIPVEDRQRVFDRFYRGAGHQSIEGNGLGLAIVDSVARANGGETWIDTPRSGAGVIVGLSVSPSGGPSGS